MSPYEDQNWKKEHKSNEKVIYTECYRECPKPETNEFTFNGTLEEFKKSLPDLYERMVKKDEGT